MDEPREFAFNLKPSGADPSAGDREWLGQGWGQTGEPPTHVSQETFQATQIGQSLPFRTGRQIRIDTLLFPRLDRLDEPPRVGDQPLPQGSLRGLVMVKPALQFPGGQWTGLQSSEQLLGVPGVGARQRGKDAAGGPRRDPAGTDRVEQRIGHRHDQLQSTLYPADIASGASGDFTLRELQSIHQLAQQQGFLDRHERARLRLCQDVEQSLGEIADPLLNVRGIAPESAKCGDAPVAVDDDQPISIGHHDARHQLPALLDRPGQPLHRTSVHQTSVGIA